MYKYYDSDTGRYSLHDCLACQMAFSGGSLSFHFPDGFWHLSSPGDPVVRTDAGQVIHHLLDEDLDCLQVFLFSKQSNGNAIREEWAPEQFISALNNGDFEIEFITTYTGFQSILYKCWVWLGREHRECELILSTDQTTYCWNHMRPERVW